MGLMLGFIGAVMGNSGVFGFGAAAGWFIGSTIGSLLSLENSHSTTSSGRITDFRSYNSKYGIPISKGYGTARFAGNLIWASPVEEIATVSRQCIKSGGVFGIGASRSCVSSTSYQYRRSGAIAFCEGPAEAIHRIWADGEIAYERGAQQTDRIRRLAATKGSAYATNFNAYNPYNNGILRRYLGTLTQKIDPLIQVALSAENSESGLDEAYAFRSMVYIVIEGIDLQPWGNRMPTFTAEVCFETIEANKYTYLERPSVYPEINNVVLGMVYNFPNLLIASGQGLAPGGGTTQIRRRAIWDIKNDGELLFEGREIYDLFSGFEGFQMLSPDFRFMGHTFTRNDGWAGPVDFLSNRINYFMQLPIYTQVGVQTAVYDPCREGFWMGGHLTADLGFYPLFDMNPFVEQRNLETLATVLRIPVAQTNVVVSGAGRVIAGTAIESEGFSPKFGSGRSYPQDYDVEGSSPAGLAGRTKQLHVMPNGGVVWMTASSALDECWLMVSAYDESKSVELWRTQKAYRIKDYLGVNLINVQHLVYIAIDNSVIIAGGLNSSRVLGGHLYKVYLDTDLDDINEEVILPQPGTAGTYLELNYFSNDVPGWQRGDIGGGEFAVRCALTAPELGGFDASALIFVDGINMEISRYESFDPLGIPNLSSGAGSLYFAHLDAAVQRPNGIAYWGGEPDDVALSYIVDDLMTKVDGTDLVRLNSLDIDVTELTDRVRGFSITRQQTIRGSVSQLMQGFFFDAVEGDGKIKFKKRGRATSFSFPEDDMRAASYGSVRNQTASVEYERRSEKELPRELTIKYPDIDVDYQQTTQRARRITNEADSNIALSFQIVFNKDEAAQVADILMFDAWQEKQTNYRFTVSQKHILVEPGDVGTIVMRDGSTKRIRVVNTDLGANGITDFTAVDEFEGGYISGATGAANVVPENIMTDRAVMPLILGVTTRFLKEPLFDIPAIVGGITSMGVDFPGGRLMMADQFNSFSMVGAKGPGQAVSWGTTEPEIGHPNNAIATNVFDNETTIAVDMIGGDFPVSGTTAEALNGERLMLIDKEIIGYKTVVSPDTTTVTGTDISFDSAANTIDSVSSDFVAAGFTTGMQLLVEEGSPEEPDFYWLVDSVTTNQIVTDFVTGSNMSATQFAGPIITIRQAGRTVIISELLRGLYGTQNFTHHRKGGRVYFPENLFATEIDPTELNTLVRGYAQGIWGGPETWGSLAYTAENISPWPPTNLGYSAGSITWDRMDRIYSDGIDPAVPTQLGEKVEAYIVRQIDCNTAGQEGTVLKEVKVNVPRTSQFSVTSLPILVDVHQSNEYKLLSHPLREVVSSTNSYSGGGSLSQMPTGEERWNAREGSAVVESIIDGPFMGTTALTFLTSNPSFLAGLEMNTGACKDIEVLTRIYPNTNVVATLGQQCGVFLRGTGANDLDTDANEGNSSSTDLNISGCMVAFSGPGAKQFSMSLYQNGGNTADGIAPDYDAVIEYDWGQYGNYGGPFWVRARAYKNRFQAKVWREGETEPSSWQLEAYDDTYGPYFGSCGFFAQHPMDSQGLYSDYFSWAHRGGTAP